MENLLKKISKYYEKYSENVSKSHGGIWHANDSKSKNAAAKNAVIYQSRHDDCVAEYQNHCAQKKIKCDIFRIDGNDLDAI